MATRLPMRRMLTKAMASVSDGFLPCPDRSPGYWFVRGPKEMFRDFVVFQSSQKSSCLAVDVAVTAFPVWDKCYGHHQMRAGTGLPNIRQGSSAIPKEEAIYDYDGTPQGAESIIIRIAEELRTYALPWFVDFRKKAKEDQVLQFGLHWLEIHRGAIPADISHHLEEELAACKYRRDRVQNSLLAELKDDLRAFAAEVAASKWQRKETLVLGLDLLSYAGQVLLISPPRTA